MSHLIESEIGLGPGHEELIFPCDCRDSDYLRITWDDDPTWRWLWIEHHHEPRGWDRIRTAWRALRGRGVCFGEIILDDRTTRSLAEFLVSHTNKGAG